MRTIVLASASPRRKEILERTGLPFRVDVSDDEEAIIPGLPPDILAKRLSRRKAEAVAARHRNALIIAADTLVVFRGRIFGKPHTASEAKRMLGILSGKRHSVITGFTIFDTRTEKRLTRSVKTMVFFRKMNRGEINGYVRSGEPLDKAGGYAIQGMGGIFIRKIEGDYYNVMGLPLSELVVGLRKFGIRAP
jgi:septum formation protein